MRVEDYARLTGHVIHCISRDGALSNENDGAPLAASILEQAPWSFLQLHKVLDTL